MRKRLSSAKPTVETTRGVTQRDFCPVHGYRDLIEDEPFSEVVPTRRVDQPDYDDVTILMDRPGIGVEEHHSESEQTE